MYNKTERIGKGKWSWPI